MEKQPTKIIYLKPSQIEIKKGFNPRIDYGDITALAKSILQNKKVKTPLRGYLLPNGNYLLKDGHRRLKAVNKLIEFYPNITLPFIVDDENDTEEQRIIDVIVCNDGLRLNPLEEAEIVNRLINMGLTETEIAKKITQTNAYISNLKLLYAAPPEIKNFIKEKQLSATLVLDILRKSKTYNKAIKTINKAIEFNKKQGKTKVLKRDLIKSQGKQNSFSALKKTYKQILKNKKEVNPKKKELFNFVKKIIEGKLSKEQLEKMFFKK